MSQSAEHVEKRAAAMRGTKRPKYSLSPEGRAAKAAKATAAAQGDDILCESCGQPCRPLGYKRHFARCSTFSCGFTDCTNKRRGSARLCDVHYGLSKHLRRHSLTIEQYLQMCAAANNQCEICSAELLPRGADLARAHNTSCIDHDHATGAVRGLLCHSCNVSLGLMKDDPARLRAAANYLEKHR